jgi:hypothetical protein
MWRVAEELILVMGIHLSAMIEASELTIFQILGVTSEMLILSVVWVRSLFRTRQMLNRGYDSCRLARVRVTSVNITRLRNLAQIRR